MTQTAPERPTLEDVYSAKADAWTLCALSLYREGVIDWSQMAAVVRACPYGASNRKDMPS